MWQLPSCAERESFSPLTQHKPNYLFSLYKELGWGFALWNFVGPFGIIDHGRPGARYEEIHGYQVDRDLLDIILSNRITS